MKTGDLVIMPGASLENGNQSIGIIIDDKVTTFSDVRAGKGRIGILWVDGEGRIDYEPKKWLEVISDAR
ncbi:hypothetical protein OAA09_01050 [bacterium]|nr:hypothetical protein [bacterium]